MSDKLNLNDIVRVKLTEIGLSIYVEHIERYAHGLMPIRHINIRNDEYFMEFQLWELMSIFGRHMHISCDAPFVDNMIYIDKEVNNEK